jgi:OOP family OmpA-OmpF porin
MNDRNRALPAPTSLAKAGVRWSAVLAAALLCACTTSSSWKASSAASTARMAKAKTVDAPYEREEVNYATPLGGAAESSDAASSSASGQAASAGTTYGDEGGMQSGAPQHAGAAQMPESAAQDGAAGAGSDFEDHAARDEDAASADSAGSTAAGEDARDDALAGTAEDSTGAGSQADAEAGREDSAVSSEAGASGRAGDASDASGAMDASAGDAGAGDASAGGAAPAADALAGAQDDHAAAMHAGDEAGSGGADSAAQAQAALQADSTAGAGTATAAADSSSMDAAAATAAASQQADTAPAQEPLIVGVVEAPGKKATRNEEVIPLTLGGLLPMTLGVDGQGEFDFDRAVLRDQVKDLLDTLVSRLKGAEYDRIEIVGHTDRIGTEDYNQYLSERRAWAVARYLAKQGVPVTKMQVEGRGMQEPITGAHECDAKNVDRDQLIVCLQKDRRVVISASIRKVDVNVQ